MTTTAAELKDAVVSALTDNGRIEKINAEIRAEIFSLLTEDFQVPAQNEITRENFVINELIREYLQFNGYSNSLSVFLRETNQPDEPMDRNFLSQAVNVEPHTQIPILYTMTSIGDYEEKDERIIKSDEPIRQKVSQNTINDQNQNQFNDIDESSSDGFFEIKST